MTDSGVFMHYGTEFSMYSGKTRSYLRYKGIPFQDRLATLNTYRKVLMPKTGVAMIPVVFTPEGEAIQDTVEIIDALEKRFPARSVYPATPRQRLVALLMELYADEWLLIPAMHYRWNFPKENNRFIHGEFGKVVSPWLPGPARRLAGRQLARRFAGFLPGLGISEKTAPEIERWYRTLLDHLNEHFTHYHYLLGERPSVGDFSLMAPLYAHLSRDPAPGAIMRERAPRVLSWIERMNTETPRVGDWLPDDQVPETLLPILQHQFETQFPVLEETVQAVSEWVEAHPGEKIPRRVGKHRYRLGDAEEERALLTFPQWKLQRPLGYYQSLEGSDRESVDELLGRVGGEQAMGMSIPVPLSRENNRLVVA